MLYIFFFSSRRRHTRFKCDWSSDVCSSDLKNGLHAEIFRSGRLHVMARRHAIEHIGFEHGVEPLPLERDAVVRQGVGVVLQMMSELWSGRVLQQRLECRQDFLPVELM